MAAIESLGLGSGVLTNDLVDKIIGAEKEASELRLTREEELVDARITAYGEIQSLTSTLQTAANALSSPSGAGATVATSSDESLLTASANALADPGVYNVEVLNTAKQHSLATGSYSSADEIIGKGTIKITFGEITYDGSDNFISQDVNPDKANLNITIDDSNKTLSGIRNAINDANAGVRASIINDGSGYRLVITSNDTGVESAMRIETLDESGALATSGLSVLGYNENQNTAANLEETAKGEDAQLGVNGLIITRDSNSVEEVIPGVTLNLKSSNAGQQITVNVEPDAEALIEKIQAFVDAYNDFKKFTDDLTSYNSDTDQAGLLLGDATIQSVQSQIRSMIAQPIEGLTGVKYRSLTELGVNTNKDNEFLLDFDTTVFEKALREERDAVVGILAKTGNTSDSQITYVNDSINTKPGSYDVEVTQLATQAQYQGGSVAALNFASAVVVDENNDDFVLNVNGTNASIKLDHGSYSTGEALAKQIALQINSNEDLKNGFHSVSVEYNSANSSFDITSNKYGSKSRVSFTSVDSNSANTLGFNILGKGTYQGVELTTINSDAFLGKGSSTLPGSRSLSESIGLNFAANNATFSLDIGGGPIAVTVNQNAAGNDLNSDGNIGDRGDTLQAIQTAIDATALNGDVLASFDDNGYLTFTTTATGSTESIAITAVGTSPTDISLGLDDTQGAQINGDDPGIDFTGPVEFNMTVDGVATTAKVSIPAATYLTGNDLANAMQLAIDTALGADPAFAGVEKGAESSIGSRDVSTAIDFSTTNAGFVVNVSGVEQEVVVTGNSGDSIVDIQAALDTVFPPASVIASLDGTGLKLTSAATGHTQYLEVTSDGRGAQTTPAGIVAGGIDFSGGNNATFTLTMDGVDINVDVDGDGTTGSNDANSTLAVVQQAIDDALVSSGQFQAGDIAAKLDQFGAIYFETQSKNGTKTAATFGSTAAIEIKNIAGTSFANLGLVADTQSNGYDALGLDDTRRYGYDVTPAVTYNYDPDSDLGSFDINIGGNGTAVSFTDLDTPAVTIFGLQDAATYSPEAATGQDVEGTINGVEAKGNGQFLTALDGNEKASNGFYIANPAADFTTPLIIDATNNTFRINVDGVEADITLAQPAAYNSGESLAAVLETAINENTTLKDANKSVVVEFNDDPASFAYQKFGIISASKGGDSSVTMVSVPAGTSTALGFIPGQADGEKGKEKVGEIDDASGIRVKVSGGGLGDRGSVTYISGFGDQLNDILKGILDDKTGAIPNKQEALDNEKEDITEERTRLEERLAAQEARLKSNFLFNDAIIQTLNSQGDFIKQQFEAMANAQKG